ncbi:hypothetical protein ACFXA3_15140, partial [Streptomyces sp. NPDC059456]
MTTDRPSVRTRPGFGPAAVPTAHAPLARGGPPPPRARAAPAPGGAGDAEGAGSVGEGQEHLGEGSVG